jgi:F-type H+-transporting ATPase subunit delta
MTNSKAASRYALAFIGVAEEQKSVDAVAADVRTLEGYLRQSKEFAAFLKSPVVSREKKKKVLAEILEKTVGDLTKKFVMILATKGREELIPEILHQFNRLLDERRGILNVTARTAVPFTEAQERSLVARIEGATKKKARVTYVLDPSLKGGFLVQHEDTVWDASVRHQLELLRERFAAGAA